MRIELLTIGDELLLGFTIDTNAAYVARALAALGVEVVRRGTVGDRAEDIANGVREALERTGAVITTGGLGPTSDDRTREAIAALFGRALHKDESVMADVAARFAKLGAKMPAMNVNQAMIPDGARILRNRHGTAPGMWLEDERGRWCVMLPGVPREMRGLLTDEVLPILSQRVGADPNVIVSRTVRTTGIGESALAEQLGGLAGGVDDLPLAFLPSWTGVDLRLTSAGRRAPEAERALAAAAAKLRAPVERYVYGENEVDLAAVVLELCRARARKVATAESCTGGLVGARITAIPGSSDVYLGGIISYANEVKEQELRVSADLLREHGAVSEPVARAMAEGVCAELGAQVGIAITGIAGPDGGTPEKPVGTTWIAVHASGETRALTRRFLGDREEIRLRASQGALDMVRRALTPQIT